MIDLQPAPVPELSQEWIDSRQGALVKALTRRRRRPMRWAAVAGATGVAATVSTLFLIGGSAPSTFAGWSATPTPPAAGQVTSAVSDCHTGLTQSPPNLNNSGNPSSLQPEVSDVRGPYTVTVFGDDAQPEVLCIASAGNVAVRRISQPGAPASPGEIAVDQISHGAHDGQAYTLVVGRTGTGVTGVTLSLSDGSQVTASSGNDVFVAWWPGSQSINSAAVATVTGISTETLNSTGPGVSSPPGSQSPSGSANSTVCLPRGCGVTGG